MDSSKLKDLFSVYPIGCRSSSCDGLDVGVVTELDYSNSSSYTKETEYTCTLSLSVRWACLEEYKVEAAASAKQYSVH